MVVQMGMRNNVRMGYAAMRVRENMLMHVRMRADKRIVNHKNGSSDHDQECHDILQRDFFVQEYDRKQDADKGREGVKGAGLCGSQVFLRADVGENAQAVSHKAEQQGERDVFCGEVHFACGKRNDDGTDSRTEAFYGYNLVCAFVRNFAGAVVF